MTTERSALERWYFGLAEQDREHVDDLRASIPDGQPHRVALPQRLLVSMVKAGVYPENVLQTREETALVEYPFPMDLVMVIDEHRGATPG